MNLDEARELEKKYLKKFKKYQLFYMLMGEYKMKDKYTIEKHLIECIEGAKEIGEK